VNHRGYAVRVISCEIKAAGLTLLHIEISVCGRAISNRWMEYLEALIGGHLVEHVRLREKDSLVHSVLALTANDNEVGMHASFVHPAISAVS